MVIKYPVWRIWGVKYWNPRHDRLLDYERHLAESVFYWKQHGRDDMDD